jgi:hypothetical protein
MEDSERIMQDRVDYFEVWVKNPTKVTQIHYDAFGEPITIPPGEKRKVVKGKLAGQKTEVKRLAEETVAKEAKGDDKPDDTPIKSQVRGRKSRRNRNP